MFKITYYDSRCGMVLETDNAIRVLYLLSLYKYKRWVVDLEVTLDGKHLDCNALLKSLKFE